MTASAAGRSDLPADLHEAMIARLTAWADDELTLAQRNGEWVGHAPILEEDIALANVTQDEMGHAKLFYDLRGRLDGSDPDRLVFFRDASAWRCAPLLELPRGDWGLTMLRQYLFDAYERELYAALDGSTWEPLAEVAAVVRKEDRFHLQHSAAWVERLGLGTDESNRRMRAALDALWPFVPALFASLPGDGALVEAGVIPSGATLERAWHERVLPHLRASELPPPDAAPAPFDRIRHTEHLAPLLADLQRVARSEGATGVW